MIRPSSPLPDKYCALPQMDYSLHLWIPAAWRALVCSSGKMCRSSVWLCLLDGEVQCRLWRRHGYWFYRVSMMWSESGRGSWNDVYHTPSVWRHRRLARGGSLDMTEIGLACIGVKPNGRATSLVPPTCMPNRCGKDAAPQRNFLTFCLEQFPLREGALPKRDVREHRGAYSNG